MYGTRKPKLTLMPLVALGCLSLAVTLPALSSTVHAAPPVAYTTVTVHRGETLWSLAERKTRANGDIQSTVDQILGANHLATADLHVGQHLRVPAKAL
ncbi:MAG: LysM peptidoglycan-binding domain-containing protein [Candidatus Elarobacter sp.]